MTERTVWIHCEGPEDAAALRELLHRVWRLESRPRTGRQPLVGEPRRETFVSGELVVEVHVSSGKQGILREWPAHLRDQIDDSLAGLGLCFDPDEQAPTEWRRKLFEEPWEELAAPAHLDPLRPDGDGFVVPASALKIGHDVLVVALPWQSDAANYDRLDEVEAEHGRPPKQCFERILLAAAKVAQPDRAELAERWVADLQHLPHITRATWKTAVRLWHALAFPDKGTADVAAQVFGQDHALWDAAGAHVVGGPVWEGLHRLLGRPPQDPTATTFSPAGEPEF